jgi:hypothetical protein
MYLLRLLTNSTALLALMITLSTRALAANAPSDASTPPAYPDTAHVCNGCHLSTIGYLSRYLTNFPQEHGQPLVISMMNADGLRRSHTVALISWQGEAWCRDEYYGAFRLGCRFEAEPNLRRITSKAQFLLEKRAQALVRQTGFPLRPAPPDEMAADQRLGQVTVAARIIPFPTTLYWVRSGRQEVPVVFFRPSSTWIAVYEPLHGTCLAQCSIASDAKVVSLAAEKLGYHPDAVRRDTLAGGGTLVAALPTSETFAAR